MMSFFKTFITLILISFNSVFAATTIDSENQTIKLSDLVGGDTINIIKTITVIHDASDTDITCGIRELDNSAFLNANTGQWWDFTNENDSSEIFQLLVTFPSACVNGTNNLQITGTVPSYVTNDESFVASFILAVRFISP
ncbi:hypothetical protein OAP83_02805 [Rickettsiales bacterium]|nr:hypothetical protein [Rickettsiales bacterium]